MTEPGADWVERPKPANVAARTSQPVEHPATGRPAHRSPTQGTRWPLVGGGLAAAALAAVLLLRRQGRRGR